LIHFGKIYSHFTTTQDGSRGAAHPHNVGRSSSMVASDQQFATCEGGAKSRRHLLGSVIGFVVPIVVFAGVYIAARPATPRHLLRELNPEMTRSEVRDLLGEPQRCVGDYTWVYRRWGNAGWVEVYFNEDGKFHSLNDESVFP